MTYESTLPRRVKCFRPPPKSFAMIDLKAIDDLARRLNDLVPPGLEGTRAELEKNFRSVLQAGLSKLDLVTREEFEVQKAVLRRTREKLEALERQFEQRNAGPSASASDTRN